VNLQFEASLDLYRQTLSQDRKKEKRGRGKVTSEKNSSMSFICSAELANYMLAVLAASFVTVCIAFNTECLTI
jgi:hypothetical protein